MGKSNAKLYLSAPLEPGTVVEENIKKKRKDVNSFDNSVNVIKETMKYFNNLKQNSKNANW